MWSRSEPGAWVSAGAHVALLGAALFLFGAERLPPGGEGIAVEVLTDNQFSEITKGEREAEVVQPEVKPRVDRQAERAEERDPGEASKEAPSAPTRLAEMKMAEREVAPPPPPPRREVAKVEPPEPPRREAERRPEPKAEAKPEPKREDQVKREEAKREEARREEARREEQAKEAEREAEEAIARAKAVAERERTAAENKARAEAQARAKVEADARARAEAEAKALAEAKAAEAKALAEAKAVAEAKAAAEAKLRAEAKAKAEAEARAKRQAEAADRFSPGDIRQLLAAREPAAATGSTGREVQRTASLGTATGTAQRLNPSQRDSLVGFLQDQIQSNYYKVPGSDNDAVVLPVMEIRLNADGTLAAEPRLLKVGPKPIDRAVAEAALRAVRKAAPFRVPAQFAPFYGDWKLLNVEFTPT